MANQQSVPITQESRSPFCCPDPITVVPVFKIRGSNLESFKDIRTWNNSFSVKKATSSPPANLSLGGINFFIKEVSRVQGVQHPCSYENQSGANFKMKSVMIVFPSAMTSTGCVCMEVGFYLYCDTGAVVTFKPAEAMVWLVWWNPERNVVDLIYTVHMGCMVEQEPALYILIMQLCEEKVPTSITQALILHSAAFNRKGTNANSY